MNDHEFDTEVRAAMIHLAESAPPAPSAAQLGLDGARPSVDEHGVESYTNVESIGAHRNRKRMFGGLAAVAVVAAGGVATLNAARGGDDAPANPEAAVVEFFDALAEEDAIGVLETIDPTEREQIVPAMFDIVSELERLEILTGTDLNSVNGFDFEVDGLVVASRRLTDEMYAVRVVEGTFTSTTASTDLPIGPGVERATENEVDLASELGFFGEDLDQAVRGLDQTMLNDNFEFIVTWDDGWHIDLDHTVVEGFRKEAQWPVPDYTNGGVAPVGSADPLSAATRWLIAQQDFDVPTLLEMLDPNELQGFQLHGPALIDIWEEAGSGADLFPLADTAEYTITSSSVTGEGDRRTVTVDGFEISYRFDGNDGSFMMTLADGCVEMTPPPDVDEQQEKICLTDADIGPVERGVIGSLTTHINVVQRDGQWYVSGIGTVRADLVANLAGWDAPLGSDPEEGFGIISTVLGTPVVPGYGPLLSFAIGSFAREDGGFTDFGTESTIPVPIGSDCYGSGQPLMTAEEAAAAADEIALCFEREGVDLGDGPLYEVGYVACSYIFNNLYDTPVDDSNGRPPVEEEAAAYQEQAECLADYGIDDSYTPTIEELEAERTCSAIYDEVFNADPPIPDDEIDFDELDRRAQACYEELEGF